MIAGNLPHKQGGVAMIIAILIVALASIAAISMSSRHERDIRRTSNILNGDQAWRYGMGAEAFVSVVLRKDADNNKYDHPGEAWLQQVNLPIEEGFLSGQIHDRQGCFNVNNLVGNNAGKHLAVLERLLGFLNLDVALAQALQDWIDNDQNAGIPDGAEDNYYFNLSPAYRSADTLMASLTELRLIKGVDSSNIEALTKALCALPQTDTAVNVNMASAELLAALATQGTTPADMSGLYAKLQGGSGFETTNDFLQDPATAGLVFDVAITTQSEWFLASASATIADTKVTQMSLIKRDANGAKIVARSRLNF
jgi:general secretion pathway protein K